MIAIALIFGELTADDFEDKRANDSRIDELRKRMQIKEDKKFSKDYLDPKKRSVSNAIQIFFKNGAKTEEVIVEYPYGHPRQRKEGFHLLEKKFRKNLLTIYSQKKTDELCLLFKNEEDLDEMNVSDFMKLWVKK